MQNSFTETFTVTDNECDIVARMTPGAILRRVQQISTNQCNACGVTAKVYEETNTAFLLAKLQMDFEKPIMSEQTITITTTPFAPVRAVYPRITQLFNEQGELLVTIHTRWVLVNRTTHRILRQPIAEITLPFVTATDNLTDVRIEKTQEVTLIDSLRAGYSRCDVNKHLNNTYYADIACDCIPSALLLQNAIKSMTIAFHNEIPLDACFTVHTGNVDNHLFYVLGTANEQKHFEVNINL